MKKRRELDALVNGSKQSSGARMKSGRHELLRNESESSEVEEFSLTPNTAARKWVYRGLTWLKNRLDKYIGLIKMLFTTINKT